MKLSDYIKDIEVSKNFPFDVDDVIHVCKRLNNSKRDFLFVNEMQGKHIPVAPREMEKLVHAYVRELEDNVDLAHWMHSDNYIIGFAETATLLGQETARLTSSRYLQTTRVDALSDKVLVNRETEEFEPAKVNGRALSDYNVKVVDFSEEHSHATEQRFYFCEDCVRPEESTANIVICEDEITTGKTILNFVDKLRELFGEKYKEVTVYALSVLNWQNAESLKQFEEAGVKPIYLVKGTIPEDMACEELVNAREPIFRVFREDFEIEDVDESFEYDMKTVKDEDGDFLAKAMENALISKRGTQVSFSDCIMPLHHTVVLGIPYDTEVASADLSNLMFLSGFIAQSIRDKGWKKVCFLGTEEYMARAYNIANLMEDLKVCDEVKFHATTRSPITLADNTALTKGYYFKSLTDVNVTNYIYNFHPDMYDGVVVLTGYCQETLLEDAESDCFEYEFESTIFDLIPKDKALFISADTRSFGNQIAMPDDIKAEQEADDV